MPRVTHVKSARKDNPQFGIKVGDSYYWWKFRVGRGSIKRVSKTKPRQSQLTMSEFLGAVYGFQERLEDMSADDGLEDQRDEMVAEIRELGEQQTENLGNMPEGLQQGDTGQLLEERASAMEGWADELEAIEFSTPEEWNEEPDEDLDEDEKEVAAEELETEKQEFWSGKLEEMQSIEPSF